VGLIQKTPETTLILQTAQQANRFSERERTGHKKHVLRHKTLDCKIHCVTIILGISGHRHPTDKTNGLLITNETESKDHTIISSLLSILKIFSARNILFSTFMTGRTLLKLKGAAVKT